MKFHIFPAIMLLVTTVIFSSVLCIDYQSEEGDLILRNGRFIFPDRIRDSDKINSEILFHAPVFDSMTPFVDGGWGGISFSGTIVIIAFLCMFYILLLFISILRYGEKRSALNFFLMIPYKSKKSHTSQASAVSE